ncbi:unnamed protein product [Kuraishia capsulata CBS 1993]|uniref:Uncharacterized protein n=1 Tax=Kuraishia capsulata CBS 1993 TaxID=1382522 RepID=W6MQL2_9ASCO|nr:uncharacterized protein KUCA_T00000140001 [Kuraishia capsulata CBS 1993]CDK24180.1 unnamed protein product [Kuraishia capsulata CBS 1993]
MTCALGHRLEIERESIWWTHDPFSPHVNSASFNVIRMIGDEKWVGMMALYFNTRKVDQAYIVAGEFVHAGTFVDIETFKTATALLKKLSSGSSDDKKKTSWLRPFRFLCVRLCYFIISSVGFQSMAQDHHTPHRAARLLDDCGDIIIT